LLAATGRNTGNAHVAFADEIGRLAGKALDDDDLSRHIGAGMGHALEGDGDRPGDRRG